MKLSVIILSYNTKELLGRCLESVYSSIKDVDFEVIVVDNASSDGSSEFVKEKFPSARLIQSSENLGFARGINRGAQEATGNYLLFLNSDAELIDKSILRLIQHFDENTSAGVIGGSFVNKDGSPQRSFGKFYHLPTVMLMLIGGDTAENIILKRDELREVDWVSGGLMMVKKEIFDHAGGFDEKFFMYIEDMELCYRIKKAGFTVLFDPSVKATHLGQGSSNRTFAVTQIYHGLLYFYKKHKPFWQYLLLRLLLTSKAIFAIIIGTITRDGYLTSTYRQALRA